ncbi:MAG TPA: hypothetical protein VMQ60_13035 [Acidobacteriaceae bacterium]|jgi:glycerol uptake facilitator-like aquaporin|nr:hypothetical protein [Acidobacteriaceae bacterium]
MRHNRHWPFDGFVAAQLAGAFAATLLFRWLFPPLKAEASAVMVQHNQQ